MKEKIKIIFTLFLLTVVLMFPFITSARSGCCSHHSGVCGCSCCDGTPLSSTCLPYYPECSGGGTNDLPSYTPSVPDCSQNSYYDNISNSCKCYSGYISSGENCISMEQYCKDLLNVNAHYNTLTSSCECDNGYNLISGKCIKIEPVKEQTSIKEQPDQTPISRSQAINEWGTATTKVSVQSQTSSKDFPKPETLTAAIYKEDNDKEAILWLLGIGIMSYLFYVFRKRKK